MQFPANYGGYTLLAQLGEGGMAEVFLARKAGPGGFAKLLVIKRILPSLAKEQEFVQMFLDEARLVARFEHPNVVQVYDLGEADSTFYLAMEYLAGQSVAGLAKEAVKRTVRVPPGLSARIVAEACAGLHYAHDFKDLDGSPLGIVHRDVSPQNLFVTYDGRVKVLDFGVAKAASRMTKTRTGSVKGKISYMAPEQCRGEAVDRRADVFALGVVLLELVSGKRIFRDDNEFALLRKLSLGEYQKPSQMGLEAPAALLAICDKAMAFRSDERYLSCADFKADLDRWLSTVADSGEPQVAALMSTLFAEDIELRKQLLLAKNDSAEVFQRVKQETSGTSLPSLGGLAHEGRVLTSATVSTPHQGLVTPPPGKWKAPAIAGAVLVAAAAAWFGLKPAGPSSVSSAADAGAPSVVAAPVERPDAAVAQALPGDAPDAAVVVATAELDAGAPGVKKDKPKPATLAVLSTPDGCAVTVNGKAQGATPQRALKVEPQAALEVAVSCSGYAPFTETVRVAAGETKTVNAAPQPLGKGFLTLKTSPWSVVFEGATELGMTPLLRLELSAGPHTFRAVNAEQRLEKTFTLVLEPGKVTSRTVELAAP